MRGFSQRFSQFLSSLKLSRWRTGGHLRAVDTGTAAGKCSFDMIGVFAQFEMWRERQLEGLAKTEAVEVYQGWASADAAKVRAMKAEDKRRLRLHGGAQDWTGVAISCVR
jgi:DNA invertase Pin-like site-specific DNA recombinase